MNYVYEHPMTGQPVDADNALRDWTFTSLGHVVFDRHGLIKPVPVQDGKLREAYEQAVRAYNRASAP